MFAAPPSTDNKPMLDAFMEWYTYNSDHNVNLGMRNTLSRYIDTLRKLHLA